MLYVTFKEPDKILHSVNAYFAHNREDEWFDDPFVKEIVKGVDNTEILGPELAMSPVLGSIPITQISAGAKALILLLKEDVVIGSAFFGDNCTEFLAEIGKMRDCTVYVEHHLHFFKNFDAVCLDDDREIHNVNEWTRLMLDNFKRRNKK
jgi:hypothetical protein